MRLVKLITLILIWEIILILFLEGKLVGGEEFILNLLLTIGAPIIFIFMAWFAQRKQQKRIHASLICAIVGSYLVLYTTLHYWNVPIGFPFVKPNPESGVEESELLMPNAYFVFVTTIVVIGAICYEVNLYMRRKNIKWF
ncbi:hypothetical protein [Kurthia zopfii]|uniref:hypothetical protein n=1 Tax=Kurthia zopfii TaxID=1650 RepID=UPI000F6DA260|nr:hypothetical protein [Kurthia zopfii]VEI08211.1 Uncharacterised protein [Kurthia zopfii]